MKLVYSLLVVLFVPLLQVRSQAANDIVDTYIERSGGRVAWDTLRSIKMEATVKFAGVALPLTFYNTNSGKQATVVDFAEKRFALLAYDGKDYWTTDLNTMTPQLEDPEITRNVELSNNDFPSPIINYEKNYYRLEYDGIVTVDSVQTFKIRVIKEPMRLNYREVENVNFYYFDTDNFNPVKIEEMQPDGKSTTFRLSDYQQVQGYTFPFTIARDTMVVKIKSVSLNTSIDGNIFEFPEIEE